MTLNQFPSGSNGRHLADDIFICIFMNEKFCILIKISLEFVPKGPIDNNPVFVQLMAWRIGDKAIIWTNADPIHWRIYVALGGDELTWRKAPNNEHELEQAKSGRVHWRWAWVGAGHAAVTAWCKTINTFQPQINQLTSTILSLGQSAWKR